MSLFWLGTCVLLGAAPPAREPAGEAALVRPRMSFREALAPYTGYRYVYSGHVGADGKVRNGGLGCSAFTSVVLHRMRDGKDWLRRYDPQVHGWYGEKAAEHFKLRKVDTFAAKVLLDPARTAELVKAGKLKGGALYYFNARRQKNGHVGFVRVREGGAIEQWHYSSIAHGLYRGDFRKWLRASMYRAATVELYVVPE
jgi:hypothetical protein